MTIFLMSSLITINGGFYKQNIIVCQIAAGHKIAAVGTLNTISRQFVDLTFTNGARLDFIELRIGFDKIDIKI